MLTHERPNSAKHKVTSSTHCTFSACSQECDAEICSTSRLTVNAQCCSSACVKVHIHAHTGTFSRHIHVNKCLYSAGTYIKQDILIAAISDIHNTVQILPQNHIFKGILEVPTALKWISAV